MYDLDDGNSASSDMSTHQTNMIIKVPECFSLQTSTVADLNNDAGSMLVSLQWIIKITVIQDINIQNAII